MTFTEYFVIYAVSPNDFRIVSDTETHQIQFYNSHQEAVVVKEKLQRKHPDVHYHVRTFNMEDKFIKEMGIK